jgi:hypothetical protein
VSDSPAGRDFAPAVDPAPDWAVAGALVIVPAMVAAAFTLLLAGEWSWPLLGPFFALLLIGLRPAVWSVASWLRAAQKRRSVLYLERRDNAASVSLVTMAGLGLAIMDVFKLPGSPYWTNQPNAGLVLAAVAVYLVWLATYSSVPDEVKRGWTRILTRKDER